MLRPNVIIPYDSTHASIPAGFTRETSLDGKYPKATAASTNPGTSGGSSTHTHTSPSHTHTLSGHTHTMSTSTDTHHLEAARGSDFGGSALGRGAHSHSGTTSAVTSTSISSETVTYSAVSNDPPYYEVIFIKSTGINDLPNNGLILNTATSRSGLTFHSASANRYLKGAATSGNAGGTGGSTTNTHTIAHTHSTSHGHTGTTGTQSTGTIDRQSGANEPRGMATHDHAFLLDNASVTSDSNSSIGSQSETVEPAYRTLNAYKNDSGVTKAIAVGDIAMWMGTLATIPLGWVLCDGTNGTPDMRDKFLKIPSTASATSTGGSNTHTHAAQGHTHGVASHTHTGSVSPSAETTARKESGSIGDVWGGANSFILPVHTVTSVSSTSDTLASANTTANSSDNQPSFTTVAYIQFSFAAETQSVVGNVLRRNDTAANSVKASIVRTEPQANSAKTNIKGVIGTFTRANIRQDTFLKRYLYRVYDGETNAFVASWANEITTQPSFRTVINGGSGELVVRMNRPFDAFGEGVDVKMNNRVEVWVSDREQTNGSLLYSGYISGYRPVLQGSKEFIEITCLPYIAEFQRFMLRDGSGNTTITFSSQDPAVILKAIVDYARADGCHINYTPSSVDLTGTTVSYTFNTSTCREALNKVIELCPEGWYWYVDPSNVIHLHAKASTATHSFRIGKNIAALETWRRVEDLVNRVYFTGGGGLYRKYENSGSIATYGLYSTKYVDQRVTTAATAQTISDRIINTKKDPEIRTKIKVVDSNGINGSFGYDIETVKVGDTMRIFGLTEGSRTISYWDQMEWDVDVWDQTLSSSAADVIQILSVTYSPNFVEIEASSRLPEIQKRIEDINRNLEDSQTVNNPSAPS